MPTQPRYGHPARSVRVPDPLWEAAKARAAERGETVTDVLVRALRRYVRVPDPLWEAAKARAAERGETVTDVLVRALRRYVR